MMWTKKNFKNFNLQQNKPPKEKKERKKNGKEAWFYSWWRCWNYKFYKNSYRKEKCWITQHFNNISLPLQVICIKLYLLPSLFKYSMWSFCLLFVKRGVLIALPLLLLIFLFWEFSENPLKSNILKYRRLGFETMPWQTRGKITVITMNVIN